jgi:hypothetical protein
MKIIGSLEEYWIQSCSLLCVLALRFIWKLPRTETTRVFLTSLLMVPIILSDSILSNLDNEWWYSNVVMGHHKTRGPTLFLMQRNLWPALLLLIYLLFKDVLWRQYKLRTHFVLSACCRLVLCYLSRYLSECTLYDLPL